MSQHLDTSSGSGDARLDIADLYVFDAEGATVLVMNLRTPARRRERRTRSTPPRATSSGSTSTTTSARASPTG